MKKKILIFAIILVALIVFRFELPGIVKNQINKRLGALHGVRGKVENVDLYLLRGGITLKDLQLVKVDSHDKYPLFHAPSVTVFLSWRELLRRHIVADVTVVDPALNLLAVPAPTTIVVPVPGKPEKEIPLKPKDLRHELAQAIPVKINSLEIKNGNVHFRDPKTNPPADIFVRNLNVEATNLTNSHKVSDSLFATLKLAATFMKSAEVNIHGQINPIKVPPEFKFEVQVSHLQLPELNVISTAYQKIDVKKGTLDLVTEVVTANGNFEGYVKPVVHDLDVADFKEDKKKGLGHAIKEQLIGSAAALLKNFPRDQQATRIPFAGKIEDPKADLWASAVAVFHNMFVAAITPHFDKDIKISEVRRKKH